MRVLPELTACMRGVKPSLSRQRDGSTRPSASSRDTLASSPAMHACSSAVPSLRSILGGAGGV